MLLNLSLFLAFTSPFEQPCEEIKPSSPYQIASYWLISLHQNYLTHIDGPRSHFQPCSSTYMKQAISKYGFFYGSLLGLDRLLRENDSPWIYPTKQLDDKTWIKVDPVP